MFGSSPGSQLTLTNSSVTNSQTYGVRASSCNAIITESNNTFSSNASGNIRQPAIKYQSEYVTFRLDA